MRTPQERQNLKDYCALISFLLVVCLYVAVLVLQVSTLLMSLVVGGLQTLATPSETAPLTRNDEIREHYLSRGRSVRRFGTSLCGVGDAGVPVNT